MTCNTGANNGTHNLDLRYDIKISSLGTPDKFKWRKELEHSMLLTNLIVLR